PSGKGGRMIAANQSPGAHIALEAKAVSNGRSILASAIEHGFTGPLDIPAEVFHAELQPFARIIREARDAGAEGYPDMVMFLAQRMEPGDRQDILRSGISELAQTPPCTSAMLAEGAARIVREYHRKKRGAEILWESQKRIADGDDEAEVARDMLHKLAELESTASKVRPSPFVFHSSDDLSGPTEAMDFVEGVLTEGGASVVYGPSNCGKSFWTVDLGVSVATGRQFRDELEVEQGAVVYVALEGSHGARNRVEALKLTGKLPRGAPFFLVFESVSLLEAGHDKRLAETIAQVSEQAGMPVKLVILDTMARAMAGGDENSGQDMTAAVASIDAVRAATGAHVLVVHHCGKDEARGARGHSSLRAAVDTEIEVSRPDGETISTVRVTKQRDLEKGEPMPFSLEVVKVGENRRGKDITSCVVRHEADFMAAQPAKKGRPPSATREELLSLLPQKSTSAWQRAANEEYGMSKSAFHRVIPSLNGHGAIRGTEGNWIPL
ncbi:MAG: AAA family ATPase, partial [Verrucomicrobiaceae bacterium]